MKKIQNFFAVSLAIFNILGSFTNADEQKVPKKEKATSIQKSKLAVSCASVVPYTWEFLSTKKAYEKDQSLATAKEADLKYSGIVSAVASPAVSSMECLKSNIGTRSLENIVTLVAGTIAGVKGLIYLENAYSGEYKDTYLGLQTDNSKFSTLGGKKNLVASGITAGVFGVSNFAMSIARLCELVKSNQTKSTK